MTTHHLSWYDTGCYNCGRHVKHHGDIACTACIVDARARERLGIEIPGTRQTLEIYREVRDFMDVSGEINLALPRAFTIGTAVSNTAYRHVKDSDLLRAVPLKVDYETGQLTVLVVVKNHEAPWTNGRGQDVAIRWFEYWLECAKREAVALREIVDQGGRPSRLVKHHADQWAHNVALAYEWHGTTPPPVMQELRDLARTEPEKLASLLKIKSRETSPLF